MVSSITRQMPMYIVLLASKDPEFPLGENRHSHHAHLAFYSGSPIAPEAREKENSFSPPPREEPLLSPSLSLSHPPRVRSPYTRSFLIFARVRFPPCTCTSRLLALCAHPTPNPTLLFSATLLSCHAALLFGSVSSPRDRESLRGERRG